MGVSLKSIVSQLKSAGRNGDTELAHVNPGEQALLRAFGGSGTINPGTGLREFFGNEGGGTKESNAHNYSGPGGAGRTGNTGGTRRGPGPLGHGGVTAESAALSGRTLNRAFASTGMAGNANRVYTPGAVPNIPDPSVGQVASFVLGGPLGPLGVLTSLANAATADKYGRGYVGRSIDNALGSVPGEQDGWSGDRTRDMNGSPTGTLFSPANSSPLLQAMTTKPRVVTGKSKTYSSAMV